MLTRGDGGGGGCEGGVCGDYIPYTCFYSDRYSCMCIYMCISVYIHMCTFLYVYTLYVYVVRTSMKIYPYVMSLQRLIHCTTYKHEAPLFRIITHVPGWVSEQSTIVSRLGVHVVCVYVDV